MALQSRMRGNQVRLRDRGLNARTEIVDFYTRRIGTTICVK